MRLAGVPKKAAKARAQELLESVNLADRTGHKSNDLSGGQQQRVAIARALAMQPSLVLADEPTAHLDYIQVDGVIRLLRTLAQPGRIVVVSTHDERLLPLADHVVELTPHAAGREGPPEPVEIGAGEVLFRQGSAGDRVYVVERRRDRARPGAERRARGDPCGCGSGRVLRGALTDVPAPTRRDRAGPDRRGADGLFAP